MIELADQIKAIEDQIEKAFWTLEVHDEIDKSGGSPNNK
jgi:hypothetical protein